MSLVLGASMVDRHKAPSPHPLFPLSLHANKTYPYKNREGPCRFRMGGLWGEIAYLHSPLLT